MKLRGSWAAGAGAGLSAARRHTLSRRRVWLGVLGDVLILVVLFTAATILSWKVVLHAVVQPRIDTMVHAVTAQISGIQASFAALPPERRADYLAALGRHSQGLAAQDDVSGRTFGEPVLEVLREAGKRLRSGLPQVPLLVRPWPSSQFWFRVTAPDGQAAWIALRVEGFTRAIVPLLGAFALMALGAAGLLVHRTRQRLDWLGRALDQVDAQGSVLPHGEGDDEADADPGLAQLRRRFGRMAERVAHTRDEQEVLLARLAGDLRAALQALRQSQPRSPQAVEAARCIDAMVATAGQLDQFARGRAQGPAPATHVNEVLLAMSVEGGLPQRSPAIRWQLGGLPYASITAADARRLFGHLLDNALRHGGGEIEVTSGLENSWIVVRVLDRGPGLHLDALPYLDRPPREVEPGVEPDRPAGLGIGLAVARQIAEANGGFLQLRPREGGGTQAEVWLPPARLD